MTLITSLIALVFLEYLGLRLTYINKREIIELSLVFILMIPLVQTRFVFLGEYIILWTSDIYFLVFESS